MLCRGSILQSVVIVWVGTPWELHRVRVIIYIVGLF